MSEERLSFVEVVELVGTKYSEPLAQAQMRLWAACISRKITRHYDDERAAAQAGKVRAEIKAKAARHAPTKARPDAGRSKPRPRACFPWSGSPTSTAPACSRG